MAETWLYAPSMFVDDTVPYTHRVLRPHWALIHGCQRCEYIFVGLDRVTNKITGAFHMILDDHHEATIRVNRIVDKFSAAVPRRRLGHRAKDERREWRVVDALTTRHIGYEMILIGTGLLGRLNGDAEIAFVLAHEIAHVVARHSSERIAVFGKSIPSFVTTPLYRRRELEADYIAVMLLAESRFDPRAALQALEKAGTMTTAAQKSSFFSPSTRPSWQKRSRFLRRKVMEKAFGLYMLKNICGG